MVKFVAIGKLDYFWMDSEEFGRIEQIGWLCSLYKTYDQSEFYGVRAEQENSNNSYEPDQLKRRRMAYIEELTNLGQRLNGSLGRNGYNPEKLERMLARKKQLKDSLTRIETKIAGYATN